MVPAPIVTLAVGKEGEEILFLFLQILITSMDTLRGRMRRHQVILGGFKRTRKLICGRYGELCTKANAIMNDINQNRVNGPRTRPTIIKALFRHALLMALPWWVVGQPQLNEILSALHYSYRPCFFSSLLAP